MNTMRFLPIILLGSLTLATSCKKEDKTSPDDSPTTATDQNLKNMGLHLDAVATGLIPDSLKATTTGLDLTATDICAGTSGLFDCQPNLVKQYATLSQEIFVEVNAIVKTLAEALSNSQLKPGAKGDVEAKKDSQNSFTKFEYDITSEDSFRILIHTESGPLIYVKVDQNNYLVKADLSKDGKGNKSMLSATVAYKNADTFTATVQLTGTTCRADNLRQPQTVILDAVSVSGVKQGKAMLYMPRWLYRDADGVTCDTAVTDAMKMTLYTDYVGDAIDTTASVYMLPVSVTDTAKFSDYKASDFCANNAKFCVNGKSLGDANVIATTYTNPFCIKDGKATWGTACSSDVSAISSPTYSAASRWVTPASIQTLGITLPANL